MNSNLSKAGYLLDPKNNIWARPDYIGINYSDGDEIEERIADIIGQARNLTVLSTELRQHCTDWPSLYHLSGTRANALRPFQDILKDAYVLEVGAGCGAITRYLGESGANVLALEGSPRRAAITQSRTRDLSNVVVVADRFDQFEWDKKFDIISLIGVLEYANLYATAKDESALAMLQRVKTMLKPNGKLILAIENQLGLKYFAGAPEDHIGQPMYGIEGRYRKNQPQTFGRKSLSNLLSLAEFSFTKFFIPFPDYKLPTCVITEAGCNTKGFDATAFAWQSVHRDYQLPGDVTFSLELAWREIFKNGLAIDLANSFLVLASCETELASPSELALVFHYSTERRPCFCKETHFVVNREMGIKVNPRALHEPADSMLCNNDLELGWQPPHESTYTSGRVLAEDFIKIVTSPGWSIQDVTRFIQYYLDTLKHLLGNNDLLLDNPKILLPNQYLDAIPSNIIIDSNDTANLIDTEWYARNGVELGYLLFRTLTSLTGMLSRFAIPNDEKLCTARGLIENTFDALGFFLDDYELNRYLLLEARLYIFSTGIENTKFNISLLDQELTGLNFIKTSRVLKEQLAATEEAKAYAERLAIERLSELAKLHERLTATEEAKDYAERLAIERLSELQTIQSSKIW